MFSIPCPGCTGCIIRQQLAERDTFTRGEVAHLLALAFRMSAQDEADAYIRGCEAGYAIEDAGITRALTTMLGGASAKSYSEAVRRHYREVDAKAARDKWDAQVREEVAAAKAAAEVA